MKQIDKRPVEVLMLDPSKVHELVGKIVDNKGKRFFIIRTEGIDECFTASPFEKIVNVDSIVPGDKFTVDSSTGGIIFLKEERKEQTTLSPAAATG